MPYFGSAFSAFLGELCVKYLEVSGYTEFTEERRVDNARGLVLNTGA